jgi:hypothetical protein
VTEVKVYFRLEAWAMVGPLGAYTVGDTVNVPPRPDKMGDGGLPGFTGEVTRIEQDGMAVVVAPRGGS